MSSEIDWTDDGFHGYYPSHAWLVLDVCRYIGFITVIAGMSALRVEFIVKERKPALYAMGAAFITGWAFVFGGGLYQFALDASSSDCKYAVMLCSTAYTLCKMSIYAFFAERIHMMGDRPRRNSLPYWFNMGLVSAGIPAMIFLNFVQHAGFDPESGSCHFTFGNVGLTLLIPLDAVANAILTAQFVYPLVWRTCSGAVRKAAVQSAAASAVALTVSLVNVVTFVAQRRQLSSVCLASCTADVVVNLLCLFFVTTPPKTDRPIVPKLKDVRCVLPPGTCPRHPIQPTPAVAEPPREMIVFDRPPSHVSSEARADSMMTIDDILADGKAAKKAAHGLVTNV